MDNTKSEEEKIMDESQPSPEQTGESEKSIYSGLGRMHYVPNRHDRRKAAAEARKAAKKAAHNG